MEKIRIDQDNIWIGSLVQFGVLGLYFVAYSWSVWAGLIFSGVAVALDFTAWTGAYKVHRIDGRFRYLFFTIAATFTAVILFFANIYELLGTVVATSTLGTDAPQFITGLWESVYFSVVTFTTLGYGDYVPQGYARIAASIQSLLGLGYFAFIIGITGSIFYAGIMSEDD